MFEEEAEKATSPVMRVPTEWKPLEQDLALARR